MESVLETLQSLGYIQILAFLFALVYIFLAAQNSIACWIFGIFSSGLWAYEAWFEYELLYDSVLNLFYVIMGGVGWWQWAQKKARTERFGIISLSSTTHLYILLFGGVVSIMAALIAQAYTNASLPFIDAPTTVFSIIATFLLIKKDIGNWVYWIVVDAIYIGIYIHKGALLFALLFLIYTVMAIVGWQKWRKLYSH
jgi:nicotinamide mononucleotide transporter